MNDTLEVLKSAQLTPEGNQKFILFDHSTNSVKATFTVPGNQSDHLISIEPCYRLVSSDGTVTYVDEIGEVITSFANKDIEQGGQK